MGGDVRKERLALLALFAGGVGIAFAPIFVRWSEVGPTSTAFWRLALAAPVMWAIAAREPGRRPVARREMGLLVLPGLFFAADLGVWHWSIRYTTVANAALLANFAPGVLRRGHGPVAGARRRRDRRRDPARPRGLPPRGKCASDGAPSATQIAASKEVTAL